MNLKDDHASSLQLIVNHNEESSMITKNAAKKLLQASSTLVRVTNGEIAKVIASERTLERRSKSLLERLRNFASTPQNQTKEEQGPDFCDLTDDEDVSGKGSFSPFTSVSSESSDAFNSWIDDDDEDIASCFDHDNDIVFQYSDNEFIVNQNRSPSQLFSSPAQSRANDNLDAARNCFEKKEIKNFSTDLAALAPKAQSLVLNQKLFPESDGMEKKVFNEADAMWRAQVSAFKSMKRLLATTTDFSSALPDLIKLRVFNEEQLERHDWFRNSSSMGILRAVDERVEADKNAMALFLVALRLHNSDLVDKIHAKIYADMTSLTGDASTHKMEHRKVSDVVKTSQSSNEPQRAPFQSFGSCGNQPSRYSRRPLTTNYDHVATGSQSSQGAYFSKASILRPTPDSYPINLRSRDVESCHKTSQSLHDVMSKKKKKNRENQNMALEKDLCEEKHQILRCEPPSTKGLYLETNSSAGNNTFLGVNFSAIKKNSAEKKLPHSSVSSGKKDRSKDEVSGKDDAKLDGNKKMLLLSSSANVDLKSQNDDAKSIGITKATKANDVLQTNIISPQVDQALSLSSMCDLQTIASSHGEAYHPGSILCNSKSKFSPKTPPLESTSSKSTTSSLGTGFLPKSATLLPESATLPWQSSTTPYESATAPFLEPTTLPLESTTMFRQSTTQSLPKSVSSLLQFSATPLKSNTSPLEFTTIPLESTIAPLESSTSLESSTTPLQSTVTLSESTTSPLESTTSPLESTTSPLESTTLPRQSTTGPFDSVVTHLESTTLQCTTHALFEPVTSLPQSYDTFFESSTSPIESVAFHSKSSTPLKCATSLESTPYPFESTTSLPESTTTSFESATLPLESTTFLPESITSPLESTTSRFESATAFKSITPPLESTTPLLESASTSFESATLSSESRTSLLESTTSLETTTPPIQPATLPLESTTSLLESTTSHLESTTPRSESATLPLESAAFHMESPISLPKSTMSSFSQLSVNNNDSPASSIRRSVSLRVTSTRCTSTPPCHSKYPSNLRDTTSQSEMLKRCNSFSVPSKQTSPPRNRNLLLNLLKERFTTTLQEVDNVTIKEVDRNNVGPCIKELVANCIVSTRSAWIIRKCPKSSEILDRFLELLVALSFNDVKDIIRNCPMTRQFIAGMIRSAHLNHQSKKIAEDDSNQPYPARESSEEAVTSESYLRDLKGLEHNNSSTLLQHDLKHQTTSVSDDTTSDVKVTPLIVSRFERSNKKVAKESFGAFLELEPDSCRQLQEENLVPKNDTDAKRLLFDLDIQETKNHLKEKEGKEKNISWEEMREKNELLAMSKTGASETLLQQQAGDQRVADNEAGVCSKITLSGSLKRQKASAGSKLSSRKYSRLHLYIRKPAAKAKVQQQPSSRVGGASAVSYVSQVLFPLAIKKKPVNRNPRPVNRNPPQESCEKVDEILTNNSKSFLGKEKFNEIFERETSSDCQEKFALKEIIAMPPVHPNHQNKTVDVKRDDFSTDVFSNEQNIENPNDINNNRSCNKLVTTLSNRGYISSPSSAKKKPIHRVSFSELPPVEIALTGQDSVLLPMTNNETEQEIEDSPVQPKPNVAPSIRSSQKKLKTSSSAPTPTSTSLEASLFEMNDSKDLKVHTKDMKPQESSQSPSPANTIDQINELLMDILEEIEAENISLNRCLNDLVHADLLTMELAGTVSSDFEERSQPCPDNDELLKNRLEDCERERCTEKLLDVLANLGLETLQKCRNTLLGRLCQLSTYKDYENGQKLAAAACTSPKSHNRLREVCHGDVPRSDDVTTPSISSQTLQARRNLLSKDPDYSSSESEEDIHFACRQQERGSCDVIESVVELKPPVASKPNQHKSAIVRRSRVNIRSLLAVLIDEGVLEPRQVWMILGAGNDASQKLELKKNLLVCRDRLLELYRVPGLEALETVMESSDEEISTNQHTRLASSPAQHDDINQSLNLSESSSVQTSELHGGNTCSLTNAARLIKEHTSLRRQQEQRLFSLTAMTSSNSESSQLRSSPPLSIVHPSRSSMTTTSNSDVTAEEMTVEDWCCHNNLASQSALALRKSGYTHPSHLRNLSEEDIEALTGLSWLHKARLWVAVENMRLNEFYRRSSSELDKIRKVLDPKQQD